MGEAIIAGKHRAHPAQGRRVFRLGGTALLGLLLAACGTPSGTQVPPACPTTLFLNGAERTAAYLPGPNPRPADLQHLAVLTDLASGCTYDDEGADVMLRFNVIAEQGPAHRDNGPVEITFFVATIGPEQQVLSKELFNATVAFPEGQQLGGTTQELTVRLPEVAPGAGEEYAVYLGFQLDDAEIQRRLEALRD
jgi:hypothetical protein